VGVGHQVLEGRAVGGHLGGHACGQLPLGSVGGRGAGPLGGCRGAAAAGAGGLGAPGSLAEWRGDYDPHTGITVDPGIEEFVQ
jgi:hypothetical protein